jgi:hypothetical protein
MDKVYATLGWDGYPITTKDGYVLPRVAELIINEKYYPKKEIGEYPTDPITGEKLQIWQTSFLNTSKQISFLKRICLQLKAISIK